MVKSPNVGTVKWLKRELDIMGVTYGDGAKKGELQSILDGAGGGGGGGGTVTVAAAAAGVKSPSPAAAAPPRAPSPKKASRKKASPNQSKTTREFLKKGKKAFGTLEAHKSLAVGKKRDIRISRRKGNITKKATKIEVMKLETEASFAASEATNWKAKTPPPMFRTRKVSPVEPTEQQITYTNGFDRPVKLAQSMLTPGFNPRRAMLSDIPGHNHPLDPGASINFSVKLGQTLYVYDSNMNPMETLSTKAHAKYGRDGEIRYVPTKVGYVKSNFKRGAITRVGDGGGGAAKSKSANQKGGRRRRTRRRRRRRRRTHR